ncbi:MAG TPA: hypothetical protein PKK26_14370 [Candidatus Wallbacteria bacterium]|nr:hypothetical protein [Candidatus Wallbacteria bacterium]
MKSKAIIFFSLIIFIFTIVIPGYRFIFKKSPRDSRSSNKTVKLEDEIEEIKRVSSKSLGVESFDPASEYDKTYMACRKSYVKSQETVRAYNDFNSKYIKATSGKANKYYIMADKLLMAGNLDKAADVLVAALKSEPDNQIMKLKIYQKLAMIGMLNRNDKTMLKALLRYVETCESLDVDQTTKSEISKLKSELQNKLASAR